MSKLFFMQHDLCDIYIRFLWIDLIIWREPFNWRNAWSLDADGMFAICTPWFDFYPYNGMFDGFLSRLK